MSCFGIKGPLQKSIITETFFFNDVEQVKEHLEQKHLEKPNWLYKVVSEDHLAEIRKQPREEFKILQCEKLHMIAFFPDGRIMGKENICSCHECLNGNLDKCEFEPDRIIKEGDVNSEDDKINGSEYEENEILKGPFFSHIKKGLYAALYSLSQASELFYLCKVLSCETTTRSISDANDHTVLQGMKYIRAHYLEKVKEKKEPCPLKPLSKKNVLPEQIFYLDVPVSEELTLDTKNY